MTLHELIARLESADGPSRELDLEIARLQGVTVMRHNPETGENEEHTYWQYTASVDAALSLVPEGFGWTIYSAYDEFPPRAVVGSGRVQEGHTAATPALALCIASLKAMEAQP